MPAPGERSGEPHLPFPRSVLGLWPPRPPARRAARRPVPAAGAPGVRRRQAGRAVGARSQGLPTPSGVPGEGLRNTTPSPTAYTCPPVPSGSRPLGGSRPRPLPLRPFPPSLSPASWETKGLFIKRIVGGCGGGGRREWGSIKTRRGGVVGGGRSCAASGSPKRPGGREAPAGARPTPPGPWALGRRPAPAEGWAAPLRCRLPARCSPGTRSRGAGAVGTARFPRGSPLGDPGPLPRQLFRNCLGSGRLCVFVPARPPRVRSARSPSQTMSRGRPRSASRKGHVRCGDGTPGGILLLPNDDDKPPQQAESLLRTSPSHPVLPPAHTLTPTLGVPGSAALSCRSAVGLSPRPEVRQFAQVPTTSGQFSGRLILLVSAQSAFNHGSKSDGPASFPSGFGHTASGQSLAEPTGPEKYLAALRGASRPPLPAPGAGLCRRSEAWELRARGRRGAPGRSPVGAALSRQLCSGLLSRGGFGRGGSARQRARRTHTPHSRSVAANRVGVCVCGGGVESCAQRPLSTGPGSGSWHAMGASPVASGPPAARGAPERSGSLPVSPAGPEKPVWLAPLCLPHTHPRPRCLTAPARFQTPDGRRGAGRGRSPRRWELRSGRPGQFERGAGRA